jgi:hypothetical protein
MFSTLSQERTRVSYLVRDSHKLCIVLIFDFELA